MNHGSENWLNPATQLWWILFKAPLISQSRQLSSDSEEDGKFCPRFEGQKMEVGLVCMWLLCLGSLVEKRERELRSKHWQDTRDVWGQDQGLDTDGTHIIPSGWPGEQTLTSRCHKVHVMWGCGLHLKWRLQSRPLVPINPIWAEACSYLQGTSRHLELRSQNQYDPHHRGDLMFISITMNGHQFTICWATQCWSAATDALWSNGIRRATNTAPLQWRWLTTGRPLQQQRGGENTTNRAKKYVSLVINAPAHVVFWLNCNLYLSLSLSRCGTF